MTLATDLEAANQIGSILGRVPVKRAVDILWFLLAAYDAKDGAEVSVPAEPSPGPTLLGAAIAGEEKASIREELERALHGMGYGHTSARQAAMTAVDRLG